MTCSRKRQRLEGNVHISNYFIFLEPDKVLIARTSNISPSFSMWNAHSSLSPHRGQFVMMPVVRFPREAITATVRAT